MSELFVVPIQDKQVENSRRWIKELRMKDLPQEKGKLRGSEGYCCLGVACDVSRMGVWVDNGSYVGDFSYKTDDGQSEKAVVVKPIIDHYGLKDSRGGFFAPRITDPRLTFPSSKGSTSLAHLNDNGTKFLEIAKIIEDELELAIKQTKEKQKKKKRKR